MSLDPVSAGIDLITSIVSRVWPDKTAEEQAKLAAALQEDTDLTSLLVGQEKTNEQEAQSTNLFVSGGRPFVMWVCGIAFAWQFVVLPILLFIGNVFHYSIPVPAFDTSTMTSVLMGMLGLSGMRSWEKYQGVNNRHG